MKKWLLTFLIYSLTWFSFDSYAQNFVPYNSGDSWGYVDRNSDSLRIEGFEEAEYFKGGYALVKKNGLYGALGKDLSVSIPIVYKNIEYLSENLLRATRGDTMHLYSQQSIFNNLYSDFAFLDGYENLIVIANEEGKYGLINIEGESIIPNKYDGPPRELISGILQFPLKEKNFFPWVKSKKIYYGALNLSGEEIIPFKYLFLNPYGADYIKATTSTEQLYYTTDGKKFMVPGDYRFAKNEFFTEVVIDNDKRAVYALNQKKPIFFKRINYSDEFAVGTDTNERLQILDQRGKHTLADSSYRFYEVKYGLIKICNIDQDGRCSGYGLLNTKGKVILPPIYPNLYDWNEEYAVCSDTTANLRVGMIDLSKNEKVLDFKHRKITLMNCGYSMADEFPGIKYYGPTQESIAPMSIKDIIPGKTKIAIDQSFIEKVNSDYNREPTNDVVFMKECSSGNRQPIDSRGAGFVKNKYGKFPSAQIFSVSINENGYKYFFIDQDGMVLTPAKYSGVSHRQDDLILVVEYDTIVGGGKTAMGAINLEGKQVISSTYDNILEVYPEALIVVKHGVMGVISKSEEVIVPIRYTAIKYYDSGYILLSKFSQWQIADENGKIITNKYDDVLEVYPDGIFKVKIEEQVFFVDDNGKEYIKQ